MRALMSVPAFRSEAAPVESVRLNVPLSELTETKAFVFPSSLYQRNTIQGVGAYSYMLFNDSLYKEFLSKTTSLCRWQTMLERHVITGYNN